MLDVKKIRKFSAECFSEYDNENKSSLIYKIMLITIILVGLIFVKTINTCKQKV
jgi:hypothetical protein